MKVQIGVIGSEEKNMTQEERVYLTIAEEVGENIAKLGAALITGGCSGISESVCKGATKFGGLTIGTPGRERGSSVGNIDVEICTPIEIGDYLFAGIPSSDAIIAFPGDAGTIAEIAIAYRYKKPIILLKEYKSLVNDLFKNLSSEYPLFIANNPKEAAEIAYKIGRESLIKRQGDKTK